jgi:predicted nucleic acid-binding protein
VGVSNATWLVDKSALARLSRPAVADVLVERIASGHVGVSIVTELEIGFSARSLADYRETRDVLVDQLLPIALPYRAEARAREVQAALVERGQHRSAGVADLLLAATAEIEGLTILHYDADFEVVAEVTGQPMEWIVPRGSVP